AEELVQPSCIFADPRQSVRVLAQCHEKGADPRVTLLHDLGHVDPEWIVAHLDRLEELELLCLQVEAQVREGFGVAIEEAWRLAADHAVERGDALLTVEQELHDSGCKFAASAV